MEYDENQKLNSFYVLKVESNLGIVNRPYQLNKAREDDELISVVHLNGPITKNGGASSRGMKEVSMNMDKMTKDDRVKGHILYTYRFRWRRF